MSIDNVFARARTGLEAARRLGVVASLSIAVALSLLGVAQMATAADAQVTRWKMDAEDLYMDGGGNAWSSNQNNNKINRLAPVTSTTSTITSWAMPEGGTTRVGSITVFTTGSPALTKVFFLEYISRPGLTKRAIGSLNLSDNTFTEWIVDSWTSSDYLRGLSHDASGNIWVGGRMFVSPYNPMIVKLDPATNTVTEWHISLTPNPPKDVLGDSP